MRQVLLGISTMLLACLAALSAPALAVAQDLTGSGSQVVPVSLSGGLTIFTWTQSSPSYDNFVVRLVDTRGEDVDLLANEVGTSSSGSSVVRVTGVNPPRGQYRLSVSASGTWSFSIGGVTAAPTSSTAFSGNGSRALGPFYLPGGSTAFSWTQSSPTYDNFVVQLIDARGEDVDLLANEVGTSSSGSSVVQVGGTNPPPGIYMLSVSASGSWELRLTPPPTYTTRLSVIGPSLVRRYGTYKCSGTLAPAAAGGRVRITWQRYSSSAFRTVTTAYAPVVAGRYAASYRPGVRGTWRVRISYSQRVTNIAVYRAAQPVYRAFTVR